VYKNIGEFVLTSSTSVVWSMVYMKGQVHMLVTRKAIQLLRRYAAFIVLFFITTQPRLVCWFTWERCFACGTWANIRNLDAANDDDDNMRICNGCSYAAAELERLFAREHETR
jgi:hypothetical protein